MNHYSLFVIRCCGWLVGWSDYARWRLWSPLEHHYWYHRRFHRWLADESVAHPESRLVVGTHRRCDWRYRSAVRYFFVQEEIIGLMNSKEAGV